MTHGNTLTEENGILPAALIMQTIVLEEATRHGTMGTPPSIAHPQENESCGHLNDLRSCFLPVKFPNEETT